MLFIAAKRKTHISIAQCDFTSQCQEFSLFSWLLTACLEHKGWVGATHPDKVSFFGTRIYLGVKITAAGWEDSAA